MNIRPSTQSRTTPKCHTGCSKNTAAPSMHPIQARNLLLFSSAIAVFLTLIGPAGILANATDIFTWISLAVMIYIGQPLSTIIRAIGVDILPVRAEPWYAHAWAMVHIVAAIIVACMFFAYLGVVIYGHAPQTPPNPIPGSPSLLTASTLLWILLKDWPSYAD